MPFVIPRFPQTTDKVALVLAFGRLSILEACAVNAGSVQRAESPCERISVLTVEGLSPENFTVLAGSHKVAPMLAQVDQSGADLGPLVEAMVENLDEKSNISMSGYDVGTENYETIVRSMLDQLRSAGLKKVRLLRPNGGELTAERVVSRDAVDVVAFPYHGEIGMGLTVWVPDSVAMKGRGTLRPITRPDISLSPRLGRLLLNLAGVGRGQTVVDPFCGSGTILVEALSMHLHCLGLDASPSRVQDTRKNLAWAARQLGTGAYDVRKGDARDLWRILRGSKVDAVVTEPLLLPRFEARPKTSTARTLIEEAGDVYSAALASMADSLKPGGRIVIVVPVILTMEGDETTLTLEGRKLGLKLFQPGPTGFDYPVRLSFESTRWVKRAVYVFESSS